MEITHTLIYAPTVAYPSEGCVCAPSECTPILRIVRELSLVRGRSILTTAGGASFKFIGSVQLKDHRVGSYATKDQAMNMLKSSRHLQTVLPL